MTSTLTSPFANKATKAQKKSKDFFSDKLTPTKRIKALSGYVGTGLLVRSNGCQRFIGLVQADEFRTFFREHSNHVLTLSEDAVREIEHSRQKGVLSFLCTVSHWFEATKHSVSDLSAVYTVIKRIIEVDCNNLIKKENYLRVVGIPMPYH